MRLLISGSWVRAPRWANIFIFFMFLKMLIHQQNCLQRGLNSRPLVYKTSALPLSYRGLQSDVISYHILANKADFQAAFVTAPNMFNWSQSKYNHWVGLHSWVICVHSGITVYIVQTTQQNSKMQKTILPDRESNPGLPRDRRRSSPLDYRGFM